MRRFKELLNKTPSLTSSSVSVTEAEAKIVTEKGLCFSVYIYFTRVNDVK